MSQPNPADCGRVSLFRATRSPLERIALIVLATGAMYLGSCPASWAGEKSAVEAALVKNTLRLIGRWSGAHACPIEPRVALTNGHVVDPRPFDNSVSPYGSAYSDGVGNGGFLIPVQGRLEGLRDLAAVEPLDPGVVFAEPFRVAAEAPRPGDRIWILGYSFKNRKSVLDDDIIEARVTRIVALHVQFYPSGEGGSSGSCVLNDAGEVVAINSAGWPTDDHSYGGQAVGIWGALKDVPRRVIE